ncbi:MAG: hypothetical protein LBK70_01910 [Clostridiales bacterium]|jgi:uncharacterized glyoxalase superfamily protein PhnB|nr:hypothetical protein [Clostridiales bacterium]
MFSVNIFVPDCEVALEFYRNVFGAAILYKNFGVELGYRYAKFRIDNVDFVISDENAEHGSRSPVSLGGVPMCLQLELDDVLEWEVTPTSCTPRLVSGVDKCMHKILELGGELVPSTVNQSTVVASDDVHFCKMRDPFGFVWSLCRKQAQLEDNFDKSNINIRQI